MASEALRFVSPAAQSGSEVIAALAAAGRPWRFDWKTIALTPDQDPSYEAAADISPEILPWMLSTRILHERHGTTIPRNCAPSWCWLGSVRTASCSAGCRPRGELLPEPVDRRGAPSRRSAAPLIRGGRGRSRNFSSGSCPVFVPSGDVWGNGCPPWTTPNCFTNTPPKVRRPRFRRWFAATWLVHGPPCGNSGSNPGRRCGAGSVSLLARRRDAPGARVVVSGWLYRTTGYVASRVRRSEFRQREQEALDMSQLQSTDEVWKRPSPELDEALSRLRRNRPKCGSFCVLDEASHREVGEVLGLSEEAVRKRHSGRWTRCGPSCRGPGLRSVRECFPPCWWSGSTLNRLRDWRWGSWFGFATERLCQSGRRHRPGHPAGWRAAWISWAAVVGMAVVVLLGVATLSSRSAAPAPARESFQWRRIRSWGSRGAVDGRCSRSRVPFEGGLCGGWRAVARSLRGRAVCRRDRLVVAGGPGDRSRRRL